MTFLLRIKQGRNAGADLEIPSDEPVIIGRLPESWLITDEEDLYVSGKHAEICVEGDRCLWTHTGRNKTVVTSREGSDTKLEENGQSIVLQDGDVIRINETVLELLLQEPGDGTEPMPPIPTPAVLTVMLNDGTAIPVSLDSPFVIGRSENCDLPIGDDPSVSRKHCRIVSEAGEFQLHNLSENGTYVNGEFVTGGHIVLKEGDQVVLTHSTMFTVTTESQRPPVEPTVEIPVLVDGPAGDVHEPILTSKTECHSGLIRYDGLSPEVSPAMAAKRLAGSRNIYAILDFLKAGIRIPDELKVPNYLFSWLPEDVAAVQSPVIISPADMDRFYDLLQESWGKDSVVCFYTSLPPQEANEHLRKSTGYSPSDPATGLLGYFWPKILNTMLAASLTPELARLLGQIDAVLLETDAAESGWSIFCGDNDSLLTEAGFTSGEQNTLLA